MDPRDKGFNYGRGWVSSEKPLVYHVAEGIAADLRKRATAASKEAWDMDMCLWRVRIASTPEEKRAAVLSLSLHLTKYVGATAPISLLHHPVSEGGIQWTSTPPASASS